MKPALVLSRFNGATKESGTGVGGFLEAMLIFSLVSAAQSQADTQRAFACRDFDSLDGLRGGVVALSHLDASARITGGRSRDRLAILRSFQLTAW